MEKPKAYKSPMSPASASDLMSRCRLDVSAAWKGLREKHGSCHDPPQVGLSGLGWASPGRRELAGDASGAQHRHVIASRGEKSRQDPDVALRSRRVRASSEPTHDRSAICLVRLSSRLQGLGK
jgi:hypothetical protein